MTARVSNEVGHERCALIHSGQMRSIAGELAQKNECACSLSASLTLERTADSITCSPFWPSRVSSTQVGKGHKRPAFKMNRRKKSLKGVRKKGCDEHTLHSLISFAFQVLGENSVDVYCKLRSVVH